MWRFVPDEWSPRHLVGNLLIHGQTENDGHVPWLCPSILKDLTFQLVIKHYDEEETESKLQAKRIYWIFT